MWTWPQAFFIVGFLIVFYVCDWIWWRRKQAKWEEQDKQRREILNSIGKKRD